jgi:uncharacterized protein
MLELPSIDPVSDKSFCIIEAQSKGRGVFANSDYPVGELVLVFTGEVTPINQINDFTHYIQIAPGLFLGPSGLADDYVNHSCEPNSAVYFENDSLVLKTIKKIKRGQEFTFDYGTVQFNEPTAFTCDCDSRKCRGLIANFYLLPPALKRKYIAKNMVPLLSRYQIDELIIQ